MSEDSNTAGLAVSMCVTLQRAAREVSGKCYQNIANMKLECSFRCCPLRQEGGEAENISNFEHFSKYNVHLFYIRYIFKYYSQCAPFFISDTFLNIILGNIHYSLLTYDGPQ